VTRSKVGQAYDKARVKIAKAAGKVLPDTCRLIVGTKEYDLPCEVSGGTGDVDGAAYRIKLPWGSPAVITSTVIVDAIGGRPQLTMQIVAPVDSSTALWQEWRTTAPVFGRVDLGL